MTLCLRFLRCIFGISIHGSRNQCHGTTRLQAVHCLNCLSSSRPDGLDFLDITRALQFNPRAAQGLEMSTRSSSSYLAIRTLEVDLQPLNLGLNSASRTLEAPRGNRHASAWGMLVMMIISNRPTGVTVAFIKEIIRLG